MGAGLGRPGSFGDFTGKEDWQVCCSGRRDDQDEGQASDPGWHQGHVRKNGESEGNDGQDRGQVPCTKVPQRQYLRTTLVSIMRFQQVEQVKTPAPGVGMSAPVER